MSDQERNERGFDELVEQMKQHHNPPPEVPRDRMWGRIESARRERRGPAHRPAWRRWTMPLAAAAVLVLGIAIGRMTLRPDSAPVVADVVQPQPLSPAGMPRGEASALVRHTANTLFARADVLLTDLKMSSCDVPDEGPVAAWATSLLVQTRLLLDSPLADDSETKTLLQDLELVLVRIGGLSTTDCAADLDRIRRDMDRNSTLDRLRHAATDGAPRFI